jgi:hypothetical protein
VRPGAYEVRIPGEEVSRTLTVSAGEHLFDGVDLFLTDKKP